MGITAPVYFLVSKSFLAFSFHVLVFLIPKQNLCSPLKFSNFFLEIEENWQLYNIHQHADSFLDNIPAFRTNTKYNY